MFKSGSVANITKFNTPKTVLLENELWIIDEPLEPNIKDENFRQQLSFTVSEQLATIKQGNEIHQFNGTGDHTGDGLLRCLRWVQRSFQETIEVCEVDANAGCAVAFGDDDKGVCPLCGLGDRGDDTLGYHVFQDFFDWVKAGDRDWPGVVEGERLVNRDEFDGHGVSGHRF